MQSLRWGASSDGLAVERRKGLSYVITKSQYWGMGGRRRVLVRGGGKRYLRVYQTIVIPRRARVLELQRKREASDLL